MKKRLFLLKAIYSAGATAFILLFFFYIYLAGMLAEGEINVFVAAAAIGGVFAAGKAMIPFMTELEAMIGGMERAIKREKERERETVYELRIVRDFRPVAKRGYSE